MQRLFVALLFFGAPALLAQAVPPAPQQGPVIRLTKKEVVLDVVVRDKHGRLVKDLGQEDFHVYEDGAPQKVTSFRNVQGQEQLEAEKAAAQAEAASSDVAHPLNSLREVNFVSIVFAPMALGNLAFAREAVLDFLKSQVLPNTYITLYRLDTRLRLVAPYTHDKDALTTAVRDLTSGSYLAHASNNVSALITNTSPEARAISGAAQNSSTRVQNTMGQASYDPSDLALARTLGGADATIGLNAALQNEANLETSLRFVENDVTGTTVLDQIEALIRSQERLAGRKVVLYLSDGLQLPRDRESVFKNLVSEANRAGVTFYTVDTRGLSSPTDNPMNATVTQMNRTTMNSQMQGALQNGSMRGPENIQAAFDAASSIDDIELLAVSNTQLALQELAARTGGFAVANTNELAKPMERVMEDIRTHYELAYSPASDVYDGHFRKIVVKVDRPKSTIQTRAGYFALPDLNGQPVQPFEMTALRAINARPAPYDFPYDAGLLEYRPGAGANQCEMLFEIPVAGLKFTPVPKTDHVRAAISVVALIQDAKGQIVSKVSRQLYREIAKSNLEAARGEHIEYAEPVDLTAGRYTLSTAVVDEAGGAASKRLSVFVKPVAEVSLSSVQVVKRVAPLTEARNPLDPFELQGRRVTLTLGDDVPSGQPVNLYFVVYPAHPATADKPELQVELFKDGKAAAVAHSELPAPDATGAIQMIAQLRPAPGHYDVQVTVRQGHAAARATRTVTVH